MSELTARFPSQKAQSWVAASFGHDAHVVGGRRLIGGVTSSVHRLTVEDKKGNRNYVVLRRWVGNKKQAQVASRVTQEAETLTSLEETNLPVPKLLAADPSGTQAGDPALLMTKVPGHVLLSPKEPDKWLRRMAAVLPIIHSSELEAAPYVSWTDPTKLEVPTWSSRPDVWRQAIRLVGERPPDYDPCFIHMDYQHFNILWTRERISGIVDWIEACKGPSDVDVGHCRLNLAVLFSSDWAERFRLAYEAEAGRKVDPWRDIETLMRFLPGWGSFLQIQAGQLKTVDQAGMKDRVEDLLSIALKRL